MGASVVEGRMHPSVVEGMHPSHEEASKHPCVGGSVSGSGKGGWVGASVEGRMGASVRWERQWKDGKGGSYDVVLVLYFCVGVLYLLYFSMHCIYL